MISAIAAAAFRCIAVAFLHVAFCMSAFVVRIVILAVAALTVTWVAAVDAFAGLGSGLGCQGSNREAGQKHCGEQYQ